MGHLDGIAVSTFTLDTFAPHVGEKFVVRRGDVGPIEIDLVVAEPVVVNPRDSRAQGKSGSVRTDPFALLFRGDADLPLKQGLYDFEHVVMGQFVMNIVPIGPGEEGLLYESIFN